MIPISSVEIRHEEDVVLARRTARQIAGLLRFVAQDQTRIATAASEVARTALLNAGGGRLEFAATDDGRTLRVRVQERGPGQRDLWSSRSGDDAITAGLAAARQLMDQFTTSAHSGGGTSIEMAKSLPRLAAPAVEVGRIAAVLERQPAESPFEEVRRQNQELLHALEELRLRQAELAQLNAELEETNRGVVALYAELDGQAQSLRRASELKSRFLSQMSHEFRSPLHSILSLSRFLLDRTDGPLTGEQTTQIGFIRRAADGLLLIVNDLLDLATVEAGKVVVQSEAFTVADLFGTLRGMFRPLVGAAVTLEFETDADLPTLQTDEGKLSQILRNFLSNALKYTEQGQIRVWATVEPDSQLTISVADTGAGLTPAECTQIFEEFVRIDGPRQRKIQGTGLGLPLARKLATLLGGGVAVNSTPGIGSVFSVTIPQVYVEGEMRSLPIVAPILAAPPPVLVIDDDPAACYLVRSLLRDAGCVVLEARTGRDGFRHVAAARPAAIVLDLGLPDMTGYEFLEQLHSEAATAGIPVIIHTAKSLVPAERERLRTAAAILTKDDAPREAALARLCDALQAAGQHPRRPVSHAGG